ncbi:MAG: zinc-dependent metalloprotease, partial [Candidatus Kapabacteria bacterium]|nr:zinc-dependent metalloprotease [Candidatus Kapabacteria bacterium]
QNQPSFLLGTFEPEDNQNGTYNVMRVDMAVTEPTKRFTGVGRYTLTVPGCTRYQGNRVFAVQAPPQATSVTFENVRSGLSVYEPQNAIRAIFRDASGNLTDNINVTPLAVTLRLPDNSTTSLALQQVSQGMYAITQPTTGYDQSGLYSLRVGTLAVLDQGFFSVAAPEFLGSLARINIVGRGYGGPSTLSDTPGYNTFLDNDGLDFDTVRVGTRSLAQNWEMVYRGMNRLRISALPQGFEVSSDNGATWITAVGGILQLPSTQGSINLPSLTPTRLTFTLNAGVKAPILIRFNPTTASAGETVGNFNLQAGSLTTPNEYRPLVRVRATRTARRLTAQRGQALFPNLKIDFADVTPNNGATLTESFTLQYDGMTSVRITAPQNYLISTADCPTPQQQCTLTGNASASMQITVHFPVPTNAGTYFGVVSILGTGIDGGQTRITIPVNCYAFQCGTIAGQREFVNIPKIKTLVIYTRGSAEQILAESNGTSCLPNAIYFKGLDVYDYVDKSIYATNRVYHNSGVGLRVTTDPVQVGTNGNDFTLRTPLIVPNDTIVSFMVNGNTVSGQLLPNVQDTMPWQTFYGTFYSNFANILNNPNSLLSLYRQSVGADIVVLIARASADSPFGGIARSKYGGAQNHYFFVEPASFIDSYIWAHEQGHVLGSDHSRYWRANPLVPSSGDNDCGALIDTENPRGRMWPTGSIMYPGLQRTPYAGNPDIYHETPETGVINPTFVPALPGYSNANEAELQGDADSRAMANLYRDDIDVQIVGNYEMNPGSSQTFTVNICGGTAPYVYQWYTLPLRQRVRPTAAGTNASLNFTMPSTAPYMLIRVVVRDAAGMKVTTEKVVTCSGCQPQTFATLGEKGATTLQNSEQLPPELPTMMQSDGRMCAMPNATGTIAFSSPDLTKESAQSNISSNIGNQSPSTLRFNQDEERPLQLNLEQNYPNPAQDETSIVFHLPKEEILKLSIYDALGKEVVLITEGRYKPGSYKFTVLLKNLSSGVYTYRLQTTKQNFIKRLVIVR